MDMRQKEQSGREPGNDNGKSVGDAKLLLRAAEAAALCGTSLRTWRSWDASGRIPQPIRVGRSMFWRPDELRDWVAAGCPNRETWQALRQ